MESRPISFTIYSYQSHGSDGQLPHTKGWTILVSCDTKMVVHVQDQSQTILNSHVTYVWLKREKGDSSMLALREWGKEEREKQREKRLDSEEIV